MIKKFRIEKCQNRYIHVNFVAFMRFREILINSNKFLEIFLSENICKCSCSKILLVRNRRFESELFEIWNHNFVISNLKWNCSNLAKTLLFELIFVFEFRIVVIFIHIMNFVAIIHAKLLATIFDINVNKIRDEKFIVIIVYWNFHYYAKLIQNNQIIHLLYRCQN